MIKIKTPHNHEHVIKSIHDLLSISKHHDCYINFAEVAMAYYQIMGKDIATQFPEDFADMYVSAEMDGDSDENKRDELYEKFSENSRDYAVDISDRLCLEKFHCLLDKPPHGVCVYVNNEWDWYVIQDCTHIISIVAGEVT